MSRIKRSKTHFHQFPFGASTGGFVQNLEVVSSGEREVMGVLRNVVLALARNGMVCGTQV